MAATLPERFREAVAELRAEWRWLAITLLLAGAGGAVFAYFRLPLPWVLGAMSVTTVAAQFGVRIWIPRWLQMPMTMVLGLLFGTTIAPDLFESVLHWLPSVIATFFFVIATTGVSMIYLMRILKADKVSAYFSSAPGGVIPMTAMGAQYGGDMRLIALAQSLRLVVTVVVVPVSFTLFAGYHPSASPSLGAAHVPLALSDPPVLIAMAFAGWIVAKYARLPAPELVGPLIVMGIAHASGSYTAALPDPLVALAQATTGARLGSAFFKLNFRTFGRQFLHCGISSLLMLAMGALFAAAVAPFTNVPITALVLAYAPGGIAEMSIVAFGLGIEVVFVITHQLIRFIFVVALGPVAVWAFKMKARPDT